MKRLNQWSEEQRMIVDSVDDIATTYDHKYWYECAQAESFVDKLWQTLADLGYLGVLVPEAYGGIGMGLGELAVLIERFAHHGVPLLSLVTSTTMAPTSILEHGDEALKERFLPGLASGELYFAFAITEPDAGTNSFRIQTTAHRDGDEYVVNGEKTFITGARTADYIQLVARTTPYEAASGKADGGTLLAVDTDLDGITMHPLDLEIPDPTGQCTVYFDDVRVPVEDRIGEEDAGFYHMFDCLNPERIASAALNTGLGSFALERGVDYAKDRAVFDAPIGSHQAVQHPLAKVAVGIELARLATDAAVEAVESGDPTAGAYANMAKYQASEWGHEAMDAAMRALGGNSMSSEYEVVNLYHWGRLGRIAPVNNEMVLNHIAESMLGLPKSY